MKPSTFVSYPWSSVLQNSECEVVAQNIMIILKRTGNTFRELTFEEYKKERLKDSGFTESEKSYFDKVISYCVSPETAKLFSKEWNWVDSTLYS